MDLAALGWAVDGLQLQRGRGFFVLSRMKLGRHRQSSGAGLRLGEKHKGLPATCYLLPAIRYLVPLNSRVTRKDEDEDEDEDEENDDADDENKKYLSLLVSSFFLVVVGGNDQDLGIVSRKGAI